MKTIYPETPITINKVIILRQEIRHRLITTAIALRRNKYLFLSHKVEYNPFGETIYTVIKVTI